MLHTKFQDHWYFGFGLMFLPYDNIAGILVMDQDNLNTYAINITIFFIPQTGQCLKPITLSSTLTYRKAKEMIVNLKLKLFHGFSHLPYILLIQFTYSFQRMTHLVRIQGGRTLQKQCGGIALTLPTSRFQTHV